MILKEIEIKSFREEVDYTGVAFERTPDMNAEASHPGVRPIYVNDNYGKFLSKYKNFVWLNLDKLKPLNYTP